VIILEHESATISGRALALFTRRVQHALGLQGEVNIRIAGNRELQDLNRRFRKKNKPTDVLSFPSDMPGLDGDIAISAEIAGRNAAMLQHPLPTEVKILVLHGLLHLAGYDHETDSGEMSARETELRREFRLPLGLIERSHSSPHGANKGSHKAAKRRPLAASSRSRKR
jgi:probable rRNA maturation factor